MKGIFFVIIFLLIGFGSKYLYEDNQKRLEALKKELGFYRTNNRKIKKEINKLRHIYQLKSRVLSIKRNLNFLLTKKDAIKLYEKFKDEFLLAAIIKSYSLKNGVLKFNIEVKNEMRKVFIKVLKDMFSFPNIYIEPVNINMSKKGNRANLVGYIFFKAN